MLRLAKMMELYGYHRLSSSLVYVFLISVSQFLSSPVLLLELLSASADGFAFQLEFLYHCDLAADAE